MFNYKSDYDMQRLADEVRKIPDSERVAFAAGVIELDLMRPGWFLSLGVGFLCLVRQIERHQAFLLLFDRVPALATDVIDSLNRHITDGEDAYDPRSAGGLCGAEVETLLDLMRAHGWKHQHE